MISVKNLKKTYRSPIKGNNFVADLFNRQYKPVHALSDVSFTIEDTELIGFIGPNGAGKTTTLKILSGILYPTSGTVDIMGFKPFEKKPAYLRQISFVMGQRNQLLWDLPASDTFKLNKEIYHITDHTFKHMISTLSDLLNCVDLIEKPVKTLSLGERMKMELIAGLLHQPKIIFFDEPTIGLDIFSQEAVRDFIKSYQSEFKSTIMLTSHYLEDVKRLASRLIIIDHGHILYDGSLATILEKYSRFKKVTVVLDKPVNETEAKGIAIPAVYSPMRISYNISRLDLPETMKKISKTLPISDMTVEDESIEDIIKTFFKEKS